MDFLSILLATFIGAGLGVFAALWLDRYLTKKRENEEARKETDHIHRRKKWLLNALSCELEKNLALTHKMKEDLAASRHKVLYYTVEMEFLKETSPLRYELFDDGDFNGLLDSIKYDLVYLDRQIDLLLQMGYSNNEIQKDHWMGVVNDILKRIETITENSGKAMLMIHNELKKLG